MRELDQFSVAVKQKQRRLTGPRDVLGVLAVSSGRADHVGARPADRMELGLRFRGQTRLSQAFGRAIVAGEAY
jgi:hypothetical protein